MARFGSSGLQGAKGLDSASGLGGARGLDSASGLNGASLRSASLSVRGNDRSDSGGPRHLTAGSGARHGRKYYDHSQLFSDSTLTGANGGYRELGKQFMQATFLDEIIGSLMQALSQMWQGGVKLFEEGVAAAKQKSAAPAPSAPAEQPRPAPDMAAVAQKYETPGTTVVLNGTHSEVPTGQTVIPTHAPAAPAGSHSNSL